MKPSFGTIVTALISCASSFCLAAPQADRVTAEVNNERRIAFTEAAPAWASADRDLGAVEPTLPLGHLKIYLSRPADREAAFQQLLNDQQNPGSTRYKHWLTPAEVAEDYGPSDQEITAVTNWLERQGMQVDEVAVTKIYIAFSGTAQQIEKAFSTNLHYFRSTVAPEGKRISITRPPQIPAALAPVIQSIEGLSQHIYHPNLVRGELTQKSGSGYVNYLFPGDFTNIYDLWPVYMNETIVHGSAIDGTGQTIAIVARSAVDPSDISNYALQDSGSSSQVVNTIVPTGGTSPGQTKNSDQDEATLDVTRSGSVAFNATIDLVTAKSVGSTDGVDVDIDYIINNHSKLGANVMSVSFGSCESDYTASSIKAMDANFSTAASEGISTVVSSGDSGVAGCEPGNTTPVAASEHASPNALCSSSYVTCVGGTEFNDVGNESTYWNESAPGLVSAIGYIPEGAWNEAALSNGKVTNSATGGGVSGFIATPTWQIGTGVPSARAGRYTPDVSFTSALHDGYALCEQWELDIYNKENGTDYTCEAGYFLVFGGTSAAAPDMAGTMALINQKTGSASGNANPSLYALAAKNVSAFHDVTVASSGVGSCNDETPSMCNNTTPGPTSLTIGGTNGYQVGTGYDEATGLGSPDIYKLIWNYGDALKSSADTTTVVGTNPTTILAGWLLPIGVSVLATEGFANPTGSATLIAYQGGKEVATLGPHTLTPIGTPQVGSYWTDNFDTSSVPPGVYTVKGIYNGSTGFSASTSQPLTITVQPTESTVKLSPASQTVTRPGNVQITATVDCFDVSESFAKPSGTVTFTAAGMKFGPYKLVQVSTIDWEYTFTVPTPSQSIPAGTYSVTASYSGNIEVLPSTSSAVTVTLK